MARSNEDDEEGDEDADADADEREGEEDEDLSPALDDTEAARRRSSAMPGMFSLEPHVAHPSTSESGSYLSNEDLEASLSTLRPGRSRQARENVPVSTQPPGPAPGLQLTLGTSASSRSSRLGVVPDQRPAQSAANSQRKASVATTQSGHLDNRIPDAHEQTPLLQNLDGRGNDEISPRGRRSSSYGLRRRSEAGVGGLSSRRGSVRSRRKSMVVVEWGESSDGQTVRHSAALDRGSHPPPKTVLIAPAVQRRRCPRRDRAPLAPARFCLCGMDRRDCYARRIRSLDMSHVGIVPYLKERGKDCMSFKLTAIEPSYSPDSYGQIRV